MTKLDELWDARKEVERLASITSVEEMAATKRALEVATIAYDKARSQAQKHWRAHTQKARLAHEAERDRVGNENCPKYQKTEGVTP